MKKRIALILGLVMLFSFAACGGSDDGDIDLSPPDDAVEDAPADVEEDAPADVEEDAPADVEEEAPADGEAELEDEYGFADIEALRPLLAINFAGHSEELTEPFGGVSFTEDYANAVLVLFDGTNYNSFLGEVWIDEETGYFVIDDPNEENYLMFDLVDNGDETYTLDAGDLGVVTVVETDADGFISMLKYFAVAE